MRLSISISPRAKNWKRWASSNTNLQLRPRRIRIATQPEILDAPSLPRLRSGCAFHAGFCQPRHGGREVRHDGRIGAIRRGRAFAADGRVTAIGAGRKFLPWVEARTGREFDSVVCKLRRGSDRQLHRNRGRTSKRWPAAAGRQLDSPHIERSAAFQRGIRKIPIPCRSVGQRAQVRKVKARRVEPRAASVTLVLFLLPLPSALMRTGEPWLTMKL